MIIKGTPQELAEFLMALTRQEEPEVEEDILDNRYFVSLNNALEEAMRSTIVRAEQSGR